MSTFKKKRTEKTRSLRFTEKSKMRRNLLPMNSLLNRCLKHLRRILPTLKNRLRRQKTKRMTNLMSILRVKTKLLKVKRVWSLLMMAKLSEEILLRTLLYLKLQVKEKLTILNLLRGYFHAANEERL